MKCLLALFLLMPSISFAQSRFDGTWEMKMETLMFSYNPLEYVLDKGMFHGMSCTPRVDVKADGSDQKVTGYSYDTLMVRVVNASSVEFIQKKNGTPTFACTEIVSPDGGTKTEEFSETPAAQRVTGKAVFTRVAKGPPGSHALSGLWQMQTVRNTASIGPLTTYLATQDGLKMSAGSESCDAKFDGKDYPVQGDSEDGSISLKRIDDNTIEETSKRNGQIVRVSLSMVSDDGKSMRVASTDIQRSGKTMTYRRRSDPSR